MTPCSKKKIRVVIPSRYGSTRLPGKPLIDLAGKPMVVRVFDAVQLALADIDVDIQLAVDDKRILHVLNAHGIAGVLTDPEHESGTDRTAEVARLKNWDNSDIVVNVQGDEPLIPADMLRAFVSYCSDCPDFSMGTISAPISSTEHILDPNVVKLSVNKLGKAIVFSRSPIPFIRDIPPEEWDVKLYRRHVGVYAYRNDVLQQLTSTAPCTLELAEKLEQLRAQWLGIPIQVMFWDKSPPHGVDTSEDAQRVSAIFKELDNESIG
jgi:3-deoxy-manno-octulosonate cytidylyltransferase (CMP-KDO synthetase)